MMAMEGMANAEAVDVAECHEIDVPLFFFYSPSLSLWLLRLWTPIKQKTIQ
jgi:hypothetical protein